MAQNLGTVVVRQDNQFSSKVTTINYGKPFNISEAKDLSFDGAQTGDAIVYNQETGTFEIAPAIASYVDHVNGGTF